MMTRSLTDRFELDRVQITYGILFLGVLLVTAAMAFGLPDAVLVSGILLSAFGMFMSIVEYAAEGR